MCYEFLEYVKYIKLYTCKKYSVFVGVNVSCR